MQQSRRSLKSRESHNPMSKTYVRGSYMSVSYDAPPLDFSFKEIESLHDLPFEKQRKGRSKDRKPIQEQKVDKKKKGQKEKEKEDFDVEESMVEEGSDEGDDQGEESKDEDGQEKKKKDECEVVRLIPPSTHMDLANQHNISLAPNQHGVTQFIQNKDGMGKSKKKKVKLVCSSLILMSNKIPDLTGLYGIIDRVMIESWNLRWLDLSHNVFSELVEDFSQFPNLQSLYLHCNRIRDMNELFKLQNIMKLRTLTIHGNPLDQLPNFRIYIIGILQNLKRLDTVLITYKERDNANVWRETFMMGRGKSGLPCVPIDEEEIKKGDDDDHDL